MKTVNVTQEEFNVVMCLAGASLRFRDVGRSHTIMTYTRDALVKYGYMQVRDVGWHHIGYYQDEEQHTFTVPTFLYEAYIK